jgi:hypothetical protein
LLEHCAQARFVWNLACEQHAHWQPGRAAAPGYNEQARQLTEARAEFAWLRAGSVTVQQQALRDFAQAMSSFFRGTHRRPSWRKASRDDGFRQVAVKPEHVQRLNRRHGRAWVPKVGWVRFRWSRAVPDRVKSYRVTWIGRDTMSGRKRGSTGASWPAAGGCWARLEYKASGRVEKVKAAYTSQQCSACRHISPDNRKSQAEFWCVACGFTCNADVNAARNIAAGRAVTARGALQPLGGAVNREPHLATSAP